MGVLGMAYRQIILRLLLTLGASLAGHSAVYAEGLQVAPVSVTISERSGLLRLNNNSENPLRAQVRVYRWHQELGEDNLIATDDLIASPPFVEIAPNGQQIVRLVRFNEGSADQAANGNICEQAFRITVDELPNPDIAAEQSAGRLTYVLRYSVPVYLTSSECSDAAPNLSWLVTIDSENASLNITNSGQMHAQIASLYFIDSSGKRTELGAGLFGYILPGSSRSFALKTPASTFKQDTLENQGQFEVLVNGSKITEPARIANKGD